MARTAQISKEKRQSTINLRHGQSIWNISRTLKVSSSAFAKTIKPYDETGSHEDRHRKGRPRVKFIRVTSLRNCSPDTVNASHSSSNRHISTTTVQRRLRELGLHGWIAAKKPILKDTNTKRLASAKKHEQWTLYRWKSIFWSDESKCEIFGSNHRVFVRRMISTCVVPTVKHVWGGVGVLCWHCQWFI